MLHQPSNPRRNEACTTSTVNASAVFPRTWSASIRPRLLTPTFTVCASHAKASYSDVLFHDLFQRKLFYRQLIAAVAEKPLDLAGIYRKLSVHKAGYIFDCIEELIEAGFLARHYTWNIKTGEIAKHSLIRIIDNYTRFSFRSIKPNRAAVERRAARLPPGSDGIFGLQFENLIPKNRAALRASAGLRKSHVRSARALVIVAPSSVRPLLMQATGSVLLWPRVMVCLVPSPLDGRIMGESSGHLATLHNLRRSIALPCVPGTWGDIRL